MARGKGVPGPGGGVPLCPGRPAGRAYGAPCAAGPGVRAARDGGL